jgi:Tol biopolymer transport system component
VIDPAVSPDGRQVAFTRWDGAELGALSVLDLETGAERVVLGDITRPKAPVWSADGGKIALSFQHGGVINPQRQCRKFKPGEKIRFRLTPVFCGWGCNRMAD